MTPAEPGDPDASTSGAPEREPAEPGSPGAAPAQPGTTGPEVAAAGSSASGRTPDSVAPDSVAPDPSGPRTAARPSPVPRTPAVAGPPESRGPSTRRRLLAGAFGVLALVAVIAGVTVLAGSGGEPVAAPAPPPASPGAPAELPPSVATPHTSAPGSEVAEPGQQPGTVRLPEGGTARLVRREVGADGALPIPQGLDEATWWGAKLGGTHGAALLSGHVNWAGKKGPFDQLWRVHQGQDVSVVDTNGGQWVYRVSAVLTLHKDDLPAQARSLFGQDGPHRLVLVTCGGDYVGGTEGYRDNRIVTAQLVSRP